jgi:hypothetical protein
LDDYSDEHPAAIAWYFLSDTSSFACGTKKTKGSKMRNVRAIGLVVGVAALLAALGSAGTASAKSTELFSGATTLTAGTTVTLSLKPEFSLLKSSTSGGLVDTCATIAIDGNTEQTTFANGPITLSVEELTWGGPVHQCSFPTVTITGGKLSITNIGNTEGTVTGSGSVWTVAIAGATCLYGTGAGTHLGVLKGGSLTTNAVINEQEPKKLLCPDTTKMTAEYVVTTPKELRVEE